MSILYAVGRPTGTGNAASGSLTISTANTYQILFAANTMLNGAFIQNPSTNTVPLSVDIAGATGTTRAGTTQDIQPGETWSAGCAFLNAITVRATSAISFYAGVF